MTATVEEMTTVKFDIPSQMAETIRKRGLLNQDGLRGMLRKALRSEALALINEFAAENERLGITPMTEEEVAEEIRAIRAEERGGQ